MFEKDTSGAPSRVELCRVFVFPAKVGLYASPRHSLQKSSIQSTLWVPHFSMALQAQQNEHAKNRAQVFVAILCLTDE